MVERYEGPQKASGEASGNDPETVPNGAPRGASKSQKTIENQHLELQSLPDCSTMLYHNGDADHQLDRWDRSGNRPSDCDTIVRHNWTRGLLLRGSIRRANPRLTQ